MTAEEKARELTIKNVTDGKSKYFSWGFYKGCVVGLEYNNKQIAELKKKLTKAEEIIKKFWEFVNNEVEFDPEHPQEHTDLWNELCEKAEQFLNSEVEE